MPREYRTIRPYVAACRQTTHKRLSARFRLIRSKGTCCSAVPRQVWYVDAQTLQGKRPGEIRHDDFVGREPVENNDAAALRIFRQARQLNYRHFEFAGSGVCHDALLGVSPSRKI